MSYTSDTIKQALETSPGITEFTAVSMSDYFLIVDTVTSVWREKIDWRQLHEDPHEDRPPLFPGELAPWFRGVSDDRRNLDPSLARFAKSAFKDPKFLKLLRRQEEYNNTGTEYNIEDIEEYLLQRFKTFGSPLIGDKLPESEISWLFILRHHSAPSRLLDWSKGSLVALHFAISKHFCSQLNNNLDPSCSWAAVWMLEPRRLVEMSTKKRRIPGATNRKDEELIEQYIDPDKSNCSIRYPLPVIPNLISPRIRSHIGRFTLHSNEQLYKTHGGLEEFAEDSASKDKISYLVKIRIDLSNIRSLGESLRTTGIADNNFSQDLDGLTDELRNRVLLGHRLASGTILPS